MRHVRLRHPRPLRRAWPERRRRRTRQMLSALRCDRVNALRLVIWAGDYDTLRLLDSVIDPLIDTLRSVDDTCESTF